MNVTERTASAVRGVRPGLRDALRGELGMLPRRLGVLIPLGVWALCIVVFAHLVAYASTAGSAWYTAEQQDTMIGAMSPAGLDFYPLTSLPGYGAPQFVLLGALFGASDHARGTLRVIAARYRWRVPLISARLIVVVLVGALVSLVTVAASAGGALVVAALSGRTVTPPPLGALLLTTATVCLVAVCFLMLGFAIGTIARSVVAAIAVGVGWVLGVETLLLGSLASTVPVIADIRGWLPVGATTSIAAARTPDGVITMPPMVATTDAGTAVVVLIGWTLIAAAVAAVTLHRRDLD